MVDARRNLFGLAKLAEPSMGAVCGVVGVNGVLGVCGTLPLRRLSYVFLDGEMAILANASFMEMDRSRLCAAGLMMGEAEFAVEVS